MGFGRDVKARNYDIQYIGPYCSILSRAKKQRTYPAELFGPYASLYIRSNVPLHYIDMYPIFSYITDVTYISRPINVSITYGI